VTVFLSQKAEPTANIITSAASEVNVMTSKEEGEQVWRRILLEVFPATGS